MRKAGFTLAATVAALAFSFVPNVITAMFFGSVVLVCLIAVVKP